MSNVQIEQYIKQARASGSTDAQIIAALQQAGWALPDINVAIGLPPAPPTTSSSVTVPAPTPLGSTAASAPALGGIGGFKLPAMDQKATGIITQCVLYSVIGSAISSGGSFIAQFFLGGYAGYAQRTIDQAYRMGYPYAPAGYSRFWLMSPGRLISHLIFAAVIGAVIGFVIVVAWPKIKQYAGQYTGGFLNTPFKILFYPSLLMVLWGVVGAYAFGMVAALIMIGTEIVGRYVFAKGVDRVVQRNFSV